MAVSQSFSLTTLRLLQWSPPYRLIGWALPVGMTALPSASMFRNRRQRRMAELTDALRARADSPNARRPTLRQPIHNARAGWSFDQLLESFLKGVHGVPELKMSDEDAIRLATEALTLIDSPQVDAFAHDQDRVQVVWHVYVRDGFGRPDLVVNPYGSTTPAGALIGVTVVFWRQELAQIWGSDDPGFQPPLEERS